MIEETCVSRKAQSAIEVPREDEEKQSIIWGDLGERITCGHSGCLENIGGFTNDCMSYKGAIMNVPLSVQDLMYQHLKSAYMCDMGEGMLEYLLYPKLQWPLDYPVESSSKQVPQITMTRSVPKWSPLPRPQFGFWRPRKPMEPNFHFSHGKQNPPMYWTEVE